MVDMTDPVPSFDTSVPNAARMYDYWLGGKDHFPADRAAAERSAQAVPQLPWLARENRKFLGRAVRFCAGEGISQFIDIGTGLPTMNSVHQVAEQVAPDARVVYVDNDPVVVSHARALLTTRRTVAIRGDLNRPDEFLSDPDLVEVIDVGKPIAVLLVAVLHFVPDEANPAASIAKLRDAMAPGSYLVISHVEMSPGQIDAGMRPQTEATRELGEARRGMPQGRPRTRDEVAAFFDGMTLVEPGLTDVWNWRPDAESVVIPSNVMTVIGGVARKD